MDAKIYNYIYRCIRHRQYPISYPNQLSLLGCNVLKGFGCRKINPGKKQGQQNPNTTYSVKGNM